MLSLSLLDFKQLDTPETIIGLISVFALIIAVIAGFFYKRNQAKK
jgi:hypothetical protein